MKLYYTLIELLQYRYQTKEFYEDLAWKICLRKVATYMEIFIPTISQYWSQMKCIWEIFSEHKNIYKLDLVGHRISTVSS